MNRSGAFILAVLVGLTTNAALADPQVGIPPEALPAVKCIYRLLKSSSAIQSVDVYSMDGFRTGIEYAFRDHNGQVLVSDIELVSPSADAVFLGDKVPRELSEEAVNKGQDLLFGLHLDEKCRLTWAFDNLLPQPKARTEWRRLDLSNELR